MKIDLNNPIIYFPSSSFEDKEFSIQEKRNRIISKIIEKKKLGKIGKEENKILYLSDSDIYFLSKKDLKRMKKIGIRI
jgi:hypothetical protein